VESFRDDLGVGFEDDGKVEPISRGVELPEKGGVNTVEAPVDGSGVTWTSSSAAKSSCARCCTVVDYPAPLGRPR
jgi:hypothetical protein